ncbi:MAG: MBL fold metallo-hydrolase [Flavipsychrobacter sp.]|nr:MBL fold metallo-hydrolase [Flavipsychrobacter sp.]
MLQLQGFTFNAFQENTYVLYNEQKHCWIIDPGMYETEEVAYLTSFINDNKLIPQAIINTHCHIDHIFGVNAIKDIYNIPFGVHKSDLPVLQGAAGSAMLFGFRFGSVPVPDFFIAENEALLGLKTIKVLFTPGHSPGSVSFFAPEEGFLISGDVLFNGSIGRTDLPGGDFKTLVNSIKTQIFVLPDDTQVFSGHGPATSIGDEKRYNPFLQD